jgi:hypothetical protein
VSNQNATRQSNALAHAQTKQTFATASDAVVDDSSGLRRIAHDHHSVVLESRQLQRSRAVVQLLKLVEKLMRHEQTGVVEQALLLLLSGDGLLHEDTLQPDAVRQRRSGNACLRLVCPGRLARERVVRHLIELHTM